MERFERLSRDLVQKGAIIDYYKDTVKVPNGNVVQWDFIQHKGAAAVIPVTDEGKILMVRQYRNALDRETLEIPAGGLNGAEEPTRDAAIRELEEETGFRTDRLELLSAALPTPAYCSEVLYIYLAGALERTVQHLDADEHLSVERIPFDTAVRMVRAGEIPDAKTQIGILLAEARRRPGACGRAADATDGKGAKQ